MKPTVTLRHALDNYSGACLKVTHGRPGGW